MTNTDTSDTDETWALDIIETIAENRPSRETIMRSLRQTKCHPQVPEEEFYDYLPQAIKDVAHELASGEAEPNAMKVKFAISLGNGDVFAHTQVSNFVVAKYLCDKLKRKTIHFAHIMTNKEEMILLCKNSVLELGNDIYGTGEDFIVPAMIIIYNIDEQKALELYEQLPHTYSREEFLEKFRRQKELIVPYEI
jgi:hypothetical protein